MPSLVDNKTIAGLIHPKIHSFFNPSNTDKFSEHLDNNITVRINSQSFAEIAHTIFLKLCYINYFSNIFGILLPSMRVPGLDACKPIPFRRVFCFLSHSDFLLQDLFSSTIFFFSSTTIHSRMRAQNRMFWTPLSSSFSLMQYFC